MCVLHTLKIPQQGDMDTELVEQAADNNISKKKKKIIICSKCGTKSPCTALSFWFMAEGWDSYGDIHVS